MTFSGVSVLFNIHYSLFFIHYNLGTMNANDCLEIKRIIVASLKTAKAPK